MSKRTVTELQAASTSDGNDNKKPFRAASATGAEEGMGEFEDGWEDEFESDEEVVNAEGEDGELVYDLMYHDMVLYDFSYGGR